MLLLSALIVVPTAFSYIVIFGILNIKLSVRNKLIPWDLSTTESFDNDFFESVSQKLISRGFELEDDYKADDCALISKSANTSRKEIYMRRFIHKSLATSAQIYHMLTWSTITSTGQTVTNMTYKKSFGLDTFFQNGRSICSVTQVEPRMLEDGQTLYLTYTNLNDLDKLIDEHLKKVNDIILQQPVKNEINEMSAEEFTNQMLKETYMCQVRMGLMKYDVVNKWFKFSLRGGIQAFLKMLKFSLFEKKKLQAEANAFVSYSHFTKTTTTPPLLFYLNFITGIWFFVTHIRLLYSGIGNIYQMMFMIASEVAVAISLLVTLIYKLIKKNQNRNKTY